MNKRIRRPRDLGNDQFSIRTTTSGKLINAKMRARPDLTTEEGRAMGRRFFQRGLDICDWFDPTKRSDQ